MNPYRRSEPHPGIPTGPVIRARPGAPRPIGDSLNFAVPRIAQHRPGVHIAAGRYTTPPRSGYVMIASRVLTRPLRGALQSVYTVLRVKHAQRGGIADHV